MHGVTDSSRLRSTALTVLGVVGVVAVLYYGKPLWLTFFFSLFLSFALRPFVSLLERARVPRIAAIVIVLGLLIGGVVLLLVNISAQVQQFYIDLPQYQDRIREISTKIINFVHSLQEKMGTIIPQDTRGIREVKITESPFSYTRAFFSSLGATLSVLFYAAAIPFMCFFMLKDREKFGRALAGLLRKSPRVGEIDVVGAVARSLTAYALGEAFVVLIMGCTTTIALLLLGVDYFYILGPLAGIAVLIPYVGVIFSTTPACLIAFFQYGPAKTIVVFLVYSVLQFLEGNLLTPYIVGGKVKLFPLTVMLAFIFWGLLWGVSGAILAVPLTSAIKVVCENVSGWQGIARLLGEPDAPVGETL
jgi:predicted PurR-regulated permease PerM